MRIFVAGATGVIGRQLVPLLRDRGHEVVGLARTPARAAVVEALGAEAALGDALDADAVASAVAGARPDVVVHELTAIPAAVDPRKLASQFTMTDRLRTEGTRNLVAAAQAAGVDHVVAQSIAFAYDPSGPEVCTEDAPLWRDPPAQFARTVRSIAALEETVRAADGCVLRYGQLYGPWTAFAADGALAERTRKRRLPVIGDGGGIFSFVSTADAATATALAIEQRARATLSVVDDEPAPVREWLPAYARALGAPAPRRVPAWLARLAVGEYGVAYMTALRGADNAAIKRELGWAPRWASWRDGFAATLREPAAA